MPSCFFFVFYRFLKPIRLYITFYNTNCRKVSVYIGFWFGGVLFSEILNKQSIILTVSGY